MSAGGGAPGPGLVRDAPRVPSPSRSRASPSARRWCARDLAPLVEADAGHHAQTGAPLAASLGAHATAAEATRTAALDGSAGASYRADARPQPVT